MKKVYYFQNNTRMKLNNDLLPFLSSQFPMRSVQQHPLWNQNIQENQSGTKLQIIKEQKRARMRFIILFSILIKSKKIDG